MDLRQMHYIEAIAAEASISRAAEKLFITRSALNYALLNAEEELGFPVFRRLSRSLVPTREGEELLAYIHRILKDCHEMQHSVSGFADPSRRQLALGVTTSGGQRGLALIFPDFHRKYPDITLHLVEGNSVTLEAALLRGEIDMAFFGDLPSDELLSYRLVRPVTDIVLTIARSSPLVEELDLLSKENTDVDLALFREQYFVLMNKRSYMYKKIRALFDAAGFRPRIMAECSSLQMATRFAEEGVCLAFMPEVLLPMHPKLLGFHVKPRQTANQTIFFRKETRFSRPEMELMDMLIARHSEVQL